MVKMILGMLVILLLQACSIEGKDYVGKFEDFKVYRIVKEKDTIYKYTDNKNVFYSTENLIEKFK